MANSGARFHFHNRAVTAAWVVTLLASGWVGAQSAPRPDALIKWRQSAYQVLAWNSGPIKAALAGAYDTHEVQSAARRQATALRRTMRDARYARSEQSMTFSQVRPWGKAQHFLYLDDRRGGGALELGAARILMGVFGGRNNWLGISVLD